MMATRPRERGDHKAEVDPRSISLGGPGKHEHMDHIQRHTAKPRANLMRSPGVSYTDARLSLWGLLTRTVTATSAPIKSARSTIANIRSPIGMKGSWQGAPKTRSMPMPHKLNSGIAVIGIDIGKNSFHVVRHDKRGAIVLRQKWSRGQVETRLANLRPCLNAGATR